MDAKRILIVDDEPDMRETCRKILARKGHAVSVAPDGTTALEMLRQQPFDLAIVDLRLPDRDGISVLREARQIHPDLAVLLITAYGTIDTAVDAVREGAFDYLPKPFSMAQLEVAAERGLEHRRLVEENRELQRRLREATHFDEIVGASPSMAAVLDVVRKVAPAEANVLVRGESGTGKELIARAIHAASRRSEAPFVPIDCASLPENLLESEMFGYEKGAFTGATASRRGLLESAARGTLFLDEIGDLSPNMQAKLLRVLQERQFRRVGGRTLLELDTRVIAATNRKLEEMVRQGTFREDLFYRLNVVSIELPPLRERASDIAALANHFLKCFSKDSGKHLQGISSAAMLVLEKYHWPGNVRELRNTIQRAVSLTEAGQITPLDLPDQILGAIRGPGSSLAGSFRQAKEKMVREFERAYLRDLLVETGGNASEAARRAGMKRSALHRLLARHGLRAPEFRK
ncbi:MAG: sigma-54 dependent transcriptional regulator [Acidobacteriota bacterium]